MGFNAFIIKKETGNLDTKDADEKRMEYEEISCSDVDGGSSKVMMNNAQIGVVSEGLVI